MSTQPIEPVVPAHVAQPQDYRSAETFTHSTPYGVLVLPKFKRTMTIGFIRRNRHLDETEMVFTLIEDILDEGQLAVFDQLDETEFGDLMKAWREDSGVGLGESSRS